MDYERYRTPTVLFPCYECATLTTSLPDASGVALCDRHQPAGLWTCRNCNCGWTNTGTDLACQRCGNPATDGYGFRL